MPNTNTAGSSSETIISVPLDIENTVDGLDECTIAAGPSKSPTKTTKLCKRKCNANNPCTNHIQECKNTTLKKASTISSIRGVALNVMDLDLMQSVIDDGNWFKNILNNYKKNK